GGTLLDQEHQLLEGELAAAGVNARDRARVTRVDVAQVVKGLFRAQLREQNPVRLHPQTGFEELLRGHACQSLIVLGAKEPHVIGMTHDDQLLRIFDGDEALGAWDLPDKSLGPGGLPGACGSYYHDVLAATHLKLLERV